jgi:acyl-homoserine lactone acylase PvdQ
MHTSSAADVADLYAESVSKNANGKFEYKYNDTMRPVDEYKVTVSYTENGSMKTKTFTTYATHHGPVLARQDGKWLSLKTKNRSLKGLIQSWERIKSKSITDFMKVLNYRSNLSNNTVYADRDGNIAYWHGNYMPRRDTSYDWELPVDGSIGKTEWKGMHEVKELVQVINPKNGWIQNTNNTPYSVSGPESPTRKNFPAYMAPDGENFRGLNAIRVLAGKDKFTLDDLITAGYDPHLTAFDTSVPLLIQAHERIKVSNKVLYDQLNDQIDLLKAWDRNAAANSVATTIGIYWAEKMNKLFGSEDPEFFADYTIKYGRVLRNADPLKLLLPLKEISDSLAANFGTWKMPWGDINRMQRIQGGLKSLHDDSKASIPVGRVSSTWGMLPSFNSRSFDTKKRYGYGGNSFVCAVEFGDKVRAKSILAGGESGDPRSPHFFDQSTMYADGKFKDVLFYKEDVLKHAKKTYHPGE